MSLKKNIKASRIRRAKRPKHLAEENSPAVHAHSGLKSLKGVLASKKGKGLSFAEIRSAAASAARVTEHKR